MGKILPPETAKKPPFVACRNHPILALMRALRTTARAHITIAPPELAQPGRTRNTPKPVKPVPARKRRVMGRLRRRRYRRETGEGLPSMPKPLSFHIGKSFPLPRPHSVRIMSSKPSFPAKPGPKGGPFTGRAVGGRFRRESSRTAFHRTSSLSEPMKRFMHRQFHLSPLCDDDR